MYKIDTQKLKQLRKQKLLSQPQLAELLNMDQSTYSRIETAKTAILLDTALKISKILEIELTDFIIPPKSK